MSNRCAICRKKIGLVPITCRCGIDLCATHKYPEEHNCKFDYKESGRKLLTQQNIKVVADKLNDRLS